MFGIIVFIILVIYVIRMFILNSTDDIKGRREFRNDHFNTYIDHNGINRDLDTNQYRSITKDYNGDIYLKGKDIGNVNISQQDREKEYQQYKNALEHGVDIGRTTTYWSPSPNFNPSKEINVLGKRYKDLKSGEILVVRVHEYKNYYVTIDTMEVLRYTDFQRYTMEQHNNYSKEKEIKDVEEFQKYINNRRSDSKFIGDPTKGIGTFNVTNLGDYWKSKKGVVYQ